MSNTCWKELDNSIRRQFSELHILAYSKITLLFLCTHPGIYLQKKVHISESYISYIQRKKIVIRIFVWQVLVDWRGLPKYSTNCVTLHCGVSMRVRYAPRAGRLRLSSRQCPILVHTVESVYYLKCSLVLFLQCKIKIKIKKKKQLKHTYYSLT